MFLPTTLCPRGEKTSRCSWDRTQVFLVYLLHLGSRALLREVSKPEFHDSSHHQRGLSFLNLVSVIFNPVIRKGGTIICWIQRKGDSIVRRKIRVCRKWNLKMKHGCVFFGDCESSGTNLVLLKFAESLLRVFLPNGLVYTNRLNQVYTERKKAVRIPEKR